MSLKKTDETRIRSLNSTQIRLLPDIKEWLIEQSKINHRSLSSEINYRIEQIKNAHHA